MFTTTEQTAPLLKQIKTDFQRTKERVIVAQVMRANGYSKAEVEEVIEQMKTSTPDIVDIILSQIG